MRLFYNLDWDFDSSLEENLFRRREVQPDDWNMLQKFVMSELNLSENGGFRDNEIDNLTSRIVHHTNCIAPIYIKEPMLTEQIAMKK